MRLSIVCDGHHTRVVNVDTGEKLEGVTGVRFEHCPNDRVHVVGSQYNSKPTVTLTLECVPITVPLGSAQPDAVELETATSA